MDVKKKSLTISSGGKSPKKLSVKQSLLYNKIKKFFNDKDNIKELLDIIEGNTKLSKDYIYNYRNKPGSYKGTPFNTAGWTSVEIAGRIIENIGPILATKY